MGRTTGTDATSPVVAAQRLAAQYDYVGAEKLLAHDTSAAAKTELADIVRQRARTRAWPDTTEVSHLFYHSLIVDPARAFAKKQPQRVGYAQYMVTISEFRAQLEQIYQHGYVLVHPQRLVAKNARGALRPATLMLPPGKKPLVLSVDDVNYYEYMTGAGFASNLTLKNGHVTNTYRDAGGRDHLGAYDVPTVIDEFVQSHPGFSYRGDKGILAVTGYNGVLGYRSSVKEYGDAPHTRSQGQQAKAVADALKAEGWQFASHTWGHINLTTAPLSHIKADARLWDTEVRPIVGPTDELVYPFGADISGLARYSPDNKKFTFLHGREGFDYFFPIDASKPSWAQLTGQSWRQARINVDGFSMQRELDGKKTALENFFTTASTIDPLRPLPLPLLLNK
ncbi:polysaccharide deacetylase [Humibacillus sp. DSM 29435]|uniref:polysaccharide deacetylase n=1 Tax=Humibacillus sp. DSM 29435 TaxID=1869167 RepID=UPI0011131A14|nr:polysaccharide deacetylase [Humibacillus sp. DSM 29435]